MNIRTIVACVVCLVMTGTMANADDSDALVQLDKEWGEAQGPEALEPLISDNILALHQDLGVVGPQWFQENWWETDSDLGRTQADLVGTIRLHSGVDRLDRL